jgi:hypothetical protein
LSTLRELRRIDELRDGDVGAEFNQHFVQGSLEVRASAAGPENRIAAYFVRRATLASPAEAPNSISDAEPSSSVEPPEHSNRMSALLKRGTQLMGIYLRPSSTLRKIGGGDLKQNLHPWNFKRSPTCLL